MSQRGDEYITIELHVSRPWKRFRTRFFRQEQSPGRKFIFFSFPRWRRADRGGEIGDFDPFHGPAKPCTHWCAREKNVYYSGVRGVVTRIEGGLRDTVSLMRLGKTDSQAERASFKVRNCWFTA